MFVFIYWREFYDQEKTKDQDQDFEKRASRPRLKSRDPQLWLECALRDCDALINRATQRNDLETSVKVITAQTGQKRAYVGILLAFLLLPTKLHSHNVHDNMIYASRLMK